VHWEDPGVVEQPDNRKIERDYLRSRSPHTRKIRQVAYHRHCVSTSPIFVPGCSRADEKMTCPWKEFQHTIESATDPAFVKQ
jgi:hypothetical protein